MNNNPVKVVQFGAGGFLRAFVDYFFDKLNKEAFFNGSIAVVNNIPQESFDQLIKQDMKYTVRLEGIKAGKKYDENVKIDVFSRAIDYYTDNDAFYALAKEETLRFAVSNTTEAGIVYNGEDKFDAIEGITYPARLTKFLYTRFQHFDGAKDKGLYLLPCELIDDNAGTLLSYVKKYIKLWDLPVGFAKWINESCYFCNTLVDRIVSGFPKNKADKYFAVIGEEDNLLDIAEPFGFWAIENKGNLKEELGADCIKEITLAEDITGYKKRKVRLLNGSHTALIAKAYLRGYSTVGEAMADIELEEYIDTLLYDEIIPTVDLPFAELKAFAESVKERFRNPYLEHMLLSIALNSVSKWKARILPTVLDYCSLKGRAPRLLAGSLGYLYLLYSNSYLDKGKLVCANFGRHYSLSDDLAVMEFFDTKPTLEDFMSKVEFWGMDLTTIEGFADIARSVVKGAAI